MRSGCPRPVSCRVGAGWDDDQEDASSRDRRGSVRTGAAATVDGSRRSMTRGTRRRRPRRRPASMRPSSRPTSAPTSTTHAERVAGSAPAKNASAARSMVRCTRKPGMIEPERKRRVAEQHREAEERRRCSSRRSSARRGPAAALNTSPAPTRPPIAGPCPSRRCRASCARRPGAQRADEDRPRRAGRRALRRRPRPRSPSTSRNSATDCGYEMHQTSDDRAAEQQELAPRQRGCGARSRGCADRSSATSSTPSGMRRRHGRPGRGTTRARPTTRCPTSTTTATAQTHSTAGVIGHDAQPVQRHAQPFAVACVGLRWPRRAARSASVHESADARPQRAMPCGPKTR